MLYTGGFQFCFCCSKSQDVFLQICRLKQWSHELWTTLSVFVMCAVQSASYLPHVGVQRIAVVAPVLRKVWGRWELVTSQLEGDLKTVSGQVVEVLHACKQRQQWSLVVPLVLPDSGWRAKIDFPWHWTISYGPQNFSSQGQDVGYTSWSGHTRNLPPATEYQAAPLVMPPCLENLEFLLLLSQDGWVSDIVAWAWAYASASALQTKADTCNSRSHKPATAEQPCSQSTLPQPFPPKVCWNARYYGHLEQEWTGKRNQKVCSGNPKSQCEVTFNVWHACCCGFAPRTQGNITWRFRRRTSWSNPGACRCDSRRTGSSRPGRLRADWQTTRTGDSWSTRSPCASPAAAAKHSPESPAFFSITSAPERNARHDLHICFSFHWGFFFTLLFSSLFCVSYRGLR